MIRAPVVCVALLASACDCTELEEARIRGGTAAQTSAAADAAALFASWLDPEPVCVPKIRFGEVRADGRYNRFSRRIRLSPDLEPTNVARVLTHEICHAVDLQFGILEQDAQTFSYAAGRAPERHSDKAVEREAVAEVCALGEQGLALAAGLHCTDDPEAALEPADLVLREVYGASPARPVGGSVALQSVVPLFSMVAPAWVEVETYKGSDVLQITVYHSEGTGRLTVDALTGERVSEYHVDLGDPIMPEMPESPPSYLHVIDSVHVPDGSDRQVLLVQAELPRGAVPRLVIDGPEGWRLLDLCIPAGSDLAVTENDVLLVSPTGEAVAWRRILFE